MKRNDIIQITDKGHPWYPALAVVEEVRSWGALAYVWMIDNTDDSNGQAYIRLKSESFETVGSAIIVNKPEDGEE
ncbi:MAG: hypothetical protein KF855_03685 [Acidobacteria bacterium]|nr:hypothetical protein [Acidobacteriota bacterium]